MVSTAIGEWQIVPDIIADGVSIQEEIMTAICETKGAAFDGTDCVGELDDSTVTVCAINFLFYFSLVFLFLALLFFFCISLRVVARFWFGLLLVLVIMYVRAWVFPFVLALSFRCLVPIIFLLFFFVFFK